jgi:hypothetical protein
MKNIAYKIVALIFVSTMLLSCKKKYVCYCSDELGDSIPFEIYATKKSAKQICNDHNKLWFGKSGKNPCSLLERNIFGKVK